jgi:hypothetical protein
MSMVISPNVPVINDVFLCAIKDMRSISSTQKNVAEKNNTQAFTPTGILRSPSRRTGGERL